MSDAWAHELASGALALARAFRSGGSLWAWCPDQPWHAHHVAVEFVHPVIVGKPALPATAVAGTNPVEQLRTLVRAGDAVVMVDADGPVATDLIRRIPAWGGLTIALGSGPPQRLARADHDVYLASASAGPVLLYHLLWELTHVCLEHPGALSAVAGETDVCTTCRDEATVAEVISVDPAGEATVRTAGGVAHVDVSVVEPVEPGTLILVHAGTAIALLAEDGE